MDRTFKAVGFSTRNDELKLRFTTDKYRRRVLERRGHKNVQLFELPQEMTREDAAEWLMQQRNVPANVVNLCHAMLETNNTNEVDTPDEAVVSKRGRGRPPMQQARRNAPTAPPPQTRGRGRPAGSKNKAA